MIGPEPNDGLGEGVDRQFGFLRSLEGIVNGPEALLDNLERAIESTEIPRFVTREMRQYGSEIVGSSQGINESRFLVWSSLQKSGLLLESRRVVAVGREAGILRREGLLEERAVSGTDCSPL